MLFEPTSLPDVVLITPERIPDERGFFAQTWGHEDFEAHGLYARMVARNVAYNREAATLRGMHFQLPPHSEAKLVSCVVGALYDVAIDLRPDSATYGLWVGVELRGETGAMLYVPEGFAHGYLTLEPNTKVEYLISAYYAPDAARGVRWDDPRFGVVWPMRPQLISQRDSAWPDYDPDALSLAAEVR
jgi:dTDP-4-dehydrorhamnose 3,5-epimerase